MRIAAAFLFVHIALAPIVFAAAPTLRVEGDDGNVALELSALTVRATIRGHLARTEFELTYRNALDRVTEGEFAFPLPADAEVSDVGLYFDQVLRHGVAVERVLARTAYEETVHARVDPALVEWNAGRTFTLRVYPIPANGEKKVFIAYDQELLANDYELDLRYARGFVKIDVDAEGRAVDNDDGIVRVRREQVETALAARAPEDGMWYASAAVDVAAPRTDMPRAPHVVILYDTSSSSVHQKSAVLQRFLQSFLARQQETAAAEVIPFHVALAPPQRIERAATPGGAYQLERVLAGLEPLGATNLIAVAGELPRIVSMLPSTTRIVLITDGLTSLGDSRDVGAAFRKLVELRRPLVVVNAARSADALLLANTAQATGGWWLDLSQLDPEAAAASAMRVPARLQLAESVLPRSLVSIGDARFAVASRAANALTSLRFGDRDLPLREVTDARAASMVRRAWARAALRDMLARGAADDEMIAHGRAFTQLTPRTSLIVLESWWDYDRYDIPLPPDLVEAKAKWEAEMEAAQRQQSLRTQLPPSKVTPGGWWIQGRVLESSGAPLPGVTVILTDNGVELVAGVTDANGHYILGVASPPKNAGVVAELAGFNRASRQFKDAVPAGATLDMTMSISSVSESITVTAQAPVLDVRATATAATVTPLRTNAISKDRLLNAIASGEIPESEEMDDEELREAIAKQRRELRQAVLEKLRGIGSTAERIRYYVSARAVLGGDKGFHVFAAEAFRERSPEIAARVLSDLAEAYPDDAPLLRILARVLDGWGEPELARLLLQRALEVAPTQPQSWREMILVEARRGRGDHVASWSKRMSSIRRDEQNSAAVYEQTAAALERWNRSGSTERQHGIDLRADPRNDITIELMFDTGWSWVDLHVLEPSGDHVTWNQTTSRAGATFTGGFTFGYGLEIYTLPNAPRGTYNLGIDYYAADDTGVSFETLVHVVVYQRGRERREHFLVLDVEEEDRVLPPVVIE